jgi:hypothetical protein
LAQLDGSVMALRVPSALAAATSLAMPPKDASDVAFAASALLAPAGWLDVEDFVPEPQAASVRLSPIAPAISWVVLRFIDGLLVSVRARTARAHLLRAP